MKEHLELDPTVEQLLKDYDEQKSVLVQDYLDHPEKLSTFMDFRVDYAFRYILGHKPILLKLINDTLPVEVSDIEYLPNEIPVISAKEKRSVFDVICTAKHTEEKFVTEMQYIPDVDMDDRLLYYGCSLVHRQIERGNSLYRLKPIYVLCIANYLRMHATDVGSEHFFFQYQFREATAPKDVFTKNLQFFFLELPRLTKIWDSLETNLERWCYLFGNLRNFAEVPENQAGFEDVFKVARTGELQGEELKKYVVSMLEEYTVYTTTEYARREGYKEEKEDVAKAMFSNGMDVQTISKLTGLSEEAVSALK